MKFRPLPAIAALAAAFAALPANAHDPAAPTQAGTQESQSARDKLAYDANKPLGTAVPEGYQPPFTQETVTRLNAIMQRAIDALDEFDRLSPELARARESGDAARVAAIGKRFGELEQQASAAKADFLAERDALIARQEFYDKNIMAAMVYYVENAPGEISEAIASKGM